VSAPPPVILESVRFSGYKGGDQDLQVQAQKAQVRTETQIAELIGVEVRVTSPDRGQMKVQADRAELNLMTDDFVLYENVRGEMGNGERFEGSEVHYNEATRRLFSDRPVRIERGNFTLEGEGMELDMNERRLRVIEPRGVNK
jgi:LPS export ABC transporter protein LptC